MKHSKTSKLLVLMICIAIGFLAIAFLFKAIANSKGQPWMALYITFLTISYHFIMRLAVGELVTIIYKNRDFNGNSFGFKIRPFETKLYKSLKVKKWKANALTAKPEQFDLRSNSFKDILHNVMQAELVHRIIMVLSFLPLLLIISYGAPAVFIVTSIFACFIDSKFVIIQRFNRPRIQKVMERKA